MSFVTCFFTFLFSDCVLRDNERAVGQERAPDQGPGHDLHPMSFLQVDGGRGPVPAAGGRHAPADGAVPGTDTGTVSALCILCAEIVLTSVITISLLCFQLPIETVAGLDHQQAAGTEKQAIPGHTARGKSKYHTNSF